MVMVVNGLVKRRPSAAGSAISGPGLQRPPGSGDVLASPKWLTREKPSVLQYYATKPQSRPELTESSP